MMLKDIKKSLSHAYGKGLSPSQTARVDTASKLIYAIISGKHCSLQRLGEHLPAHTDLESRIKKAKRFLSSKYTDFQTFYLPHLHLLFERLKEKELVFMIDGSEVGIGCTALMVSVQWRNRALPVCWLVRKGEKGHMPVSAHLDVLRTLVEVLPQTHKPVVLLGDGEFDSSLLQDFCQAQGWAYVVRTAKNATINTHPSLEGAFPIASLYPMEAHDYWLVESVYFTNKLFGPVNAMVWHHTKCQEPIYLISNVEWAKDIMDYYERRFLIETMFRDVKSSGFNIHKVRIKKPEILHALLILVSIAYLVTAAFGAFESKWKQFRAKFARKDRMQELSIFQIGLRAIGYCIKNRIKIPPKFSKNFFNYFCVRF